MGRPFNDVAIIVWPIGSAVLDVEGAPARPAASTAALSSAGASLLGDIHPMMSHARQMREWTASQLHQISRGD